MTGHAYLPYQPYRVKYETKLYNNKNKQKIHNDKITTGELPL